MHLRPYQSQALTSLRLEMQHGRNRIILCSPTGSGKTVMFSTMAASAIAKGKRVLIVTDRLELMQQSKGALTMLNLKAETIEAGKMTIKPADLYVGMVETISRRLTSHPGFQRFFQSFHLVIFDEAHKQAFDKLFAYLQPMQAVIGATATPMRQGNQKPLSEKYHSIVETISIPELISQGYLSTPKSYGVPVDLSDVKMKGSDYDSESLGKQYSKNRVFEGVIENYNRITPGQKGIAFCPNIASSKELCAKMVNAGINAMHLDSEMDSKQRAEVLAKFKANPDAVLCNVGILTTGFDAPDIEVVILYRATTSLPLFLQMVGRGSRVTASKNQFTILDFGENIRRHGFWEHDRVWSLKKKALKAKQPPSCKNCPKCNALLYASKRVCDCGHVFNMRQHDKEVKFAELRLMDGKAVRQKARMMPLEELAELAKAKIIKPYWVLHNMQSIVEARKFVQLMGWKEGWLHINRDRFPNLR